MISFYSESRYWYYIPIQSLQVYGHYFFYLFGLFSSFACGNISGQVWQVCRIVVVSIHS